MFDSGTKDSIGIDANTHEAGVPWPNPVEFYNMIHGSFRPFEIPADIVGHHEHTSNTTIPRSDLSGATQAHTIQPITTKPKPADTGIFANGFRIQIPRTTASNPHSTSTPPVTPTKNTTTSSLSIAEWGHQNDPTPSAKETKVDHTEGASTKEKQPVEPPKSANTERPTASEQAAAPPMPAKKPSLNASPNLPTSSTSSSSSPSNGDRSVGEQSTPPTRFSSAAAGGKIWSPTADSPTEVSTPDPSPTTNLCPSPVSMSTALMDIELLLTKPSSLAPNEKRTEAKPSPFSLNKTVIGPQNPAHEAPTMEEIYGFDPYEDHLLPTTPVEECGAVDGEEAPKVIRPEIPILAPRPRPPVSPRPLSASRWAHDRTIPLPPSTAMDCEPDGPEPPLAYLSASVGPPNGTTRDPPRPFTPPSPAPTLDEEGDEILSDADDVTAAECSSPDVEMLDSPSEDDSDEDTVMSDASSSSSRSSSRRSFRVAKRGRQAPSSPRRAGEHLEAPKQPRLSPPVKASPRPRSKSPYQTLCSKGLLLFKTQLQIAAC